ncbi:MAG: patatin-like phospholipase family protein [Bryobacteraceae bacterium]
MGKTALVLSGGGMFGAYQAGAWRVLSQHVEPDMVIGVSVGALNGWCIASRLPAEQLVSYWLDSEAGNLMRTRFPRTPWSGIFDPGPLERRAKILVENSQPRMDFGVVVTELPRLRLRMFSGAEVTWKHLVASCSVPGGFPPVRLGQGLYCDGGILEAMPLWAAVQMGATNVVAVNSLRFRPPVALRIFSRGVRAAAPARPQDHSGPSVCTVYPSALLGNFSDGSRWRRDRILEWIRLGEEDAAAAVRSPGFPRLQHV